MFRPRLLATGALLVAIGFGSGVGSDVGGTVLALDPAVSGPATVLDVAERGEQVQVNLPPAAPTAQYRVTVTVNWTSATHPGTLPSNAHLSRPVFAVHDAPGAMFRVGSPASAGIEAMAERGSTGTLVSELTSPSRPRQVIVDFDFPAPAIGTRTFDATVSQLEHRISLVSMLAPSPDWFVGFADRATFVDGQWIDSITFPLGNYDAGTDSGSTFTAGNVDTRPALPVSGPRDAAFMAAAAENPFGTVTITRIG